MGVHDGHRERLRENFLEYGLESANDLNALELLLFYAIPRRDTNTIAHELINRFGSLGGVFRASLEELCDVPGIGRNAAALILLVPQIVKKSYVSETKSLVQVKCSEDAGKYLMPRFMNEQDEVAFLLCLDSQNRIIKCAEVGRGIVDSVDINTRIIVETAVKCKASSVIISHNHPDGIALPSPADGNATKQIAKSLALVGIQLIDHIIVSGDDYVSFSDSGFMRLLKM